MTTPILVTTYNRPDLLTNLLENLASTKVKKIYFNIDGPKKFSDIEAQDQILKSINSITWLEEKKINRNISNLGLNMSVRNAINWVFEQENKCIILEDDLVINQNSLDFIEFGLEMIENNSKIFSVTACNIASNDLNTENFLTFNKSIFFESWGWGVWKESWNKVNFNLEMWPKTIEELKKDKLYQKLDFDYWSKVFSLVENQKIDSWAFRVMHFIFNQKLLTLMPNINLIKNNGFGTSASNTIFTKIKMKIENNNIHNAKFNLNYNSKFDDWLNKNHFNLNFRKKLFYTLKKHNVI